MKELKIQKTNLVALVDDEDFDRLSKFKWYLRNKGSVGRTTYERLGYGQYSYGYISLAEAAISKQGVMVDHADRNFLNNQKYNLRECHSSQNNHNRTKCDWSESRFIGIHKAMGKWRAQFTKDKKRIYVGRFVSEIEAARAYDAKAKELFGEFANLNFPNE